MRENRTYGSEGGEPGNRASPTPIVVLSLICMNLGVVLRRGDERYKIAHSRSVPNHRIAA